MTYFAYLRVSTDTQDTQNQKLGILEYCHHQSFHPLTFIEDHQSGKIPWQERQIGKIFDQAKEGDHIVVSEVSRIGRSTLQVLEVLEFAAKKGISVHITKNKMRMDGSLQSTITATILGLASQIEREFISQRTKEALALCKKNGKKLGRPKGKSEYLKLDHQREQITGYVKKGINKRAISKLVDCSPSTLYQWLKRRRIGTV